MKKGINISMDTRETIIAGSSFVLGTFLLALCYNVFFMPNDIVVGGMSGIGMMLERLTGFKSQLFIYISSTILLIVSFIFIGKEETRNTVIGTFLYPLFITFTEPIANLILSNISFSEILVTVVLASISYGIACGLIYKYGFSTGGSDVLMKLVSKYAHFSEGTASVIVNISIILASSFIFGVDNASYAVIILVVSSIIVDKIEIGISDTKKFMIYTGKVNKVKKIITNEFGTGYTVFPTRGGYSHVRGSMIMVVIRNRDMNLIKERILDVDPDAFFVISDCYEVHGGTRKSNIPFLND